MRSFDPRPDQLETISSITAALAGEGTRASIILPCGYGKTFVAQQAAEELTSGLPDPLILVAVPNLVLVDQMIQDWTKNASQGCEFTALPVNSRRGRKIEDEITGITIEGVTSDPDEIARFITGAGRRVVFSTYQSMDAIGAAVRKVAAWQPGFAFDLAIADEAHRTAGPVRGGEPSVYKTILDNEKIPARRRAFYTATPRVASNKAGSDEHPYSMDNVASYGRMVVNKSLTWAQQQGLLVEHDVFVVNVDDDGLHRLLKANPLIQVDGSAHEARMVAAAIALAQTARQRSLGGVITYHSSIANAQAFQLILGKVVDTLPASEKPAGKLITGHVNGSMKGNERAEQIALLDAANRAPDDWAVITNCTCLAEGVNVPSMDAVVFVDPRKSLVDITQSVGRPVRRDPNRPHKRATVLVPAYIGSFQTAEQAIDDGRYEAVFQVIKALSDSDEGLAEAFRGGDSSATSPQALNAGSAGPGDSPAGSGEEVPEDQSANSRLTILAPRKWWEPGSTAAATEAWSSWHESLKSQLVRRSSQNTAALLEALAGFFSAHGRPPRGQETFHSLPVGKWLETSRSRIRRGVASRHITEAIAAISPVLLEDQAQSHLQKHLQALSRFKEQYGRPPMRSESYDGLKIGSWLASQKASKLQGPEAENRRSEIQRIFPEAFETRDLDAERKEFLGALERFVVRDGRPPRKGETLDGCAVGQWLDSQKALRRQGKLPKWLEAAIAEVSPTVFAAAFQARSDRNLAALEGFVLTHGRPPKRFEVFADVRVGSIYSHLKTKFKEGRLPEADRKRLDSVFPGSFPAPGNHRDEAEGNDAEAA